MNDLNAPNVPNEINEINEINAPNVLNNNAFQSHPRYPRAFFKNSAANINSTSPNTLIV
jgi:hypothetical protein